ncbi:MAG: alanine--tRNA ligase [Deltaproteobacteria bacterium]|nr:alanine--tRNA ligase [Deltaproteobacteria bacterium]MCL5276620.1 alanine--tRNA ligase [Deltaproteobacteria bacterium]
MNTKEIRDTFLRYFASQGHRLVPSSSLVPQNDPTLLFTNAGMVQFKRIFTGEEKADYLRACTSQKCVRAGGKHNDLENVGYTARHHTFFEMLGNFSFGDYFKKDAIRFAWELLTKEFGLPQERLWITTFKDDDEAYRIWNRDIGVPSARIVRMDERDNFWSMGDAGPCGPCSEIIFDQGDTVKCEDPECGVGCGCDRYLEIWNLVFMQYNKQQDGTLVPLPKPSIDTGMGLERISAVISGATSNYDIDIFRGIIESLEGILHVAYEPASFSGTALKVMADHIRAAVFLIGDGVLPSNEQRGYVLRRILRRALRYAFMVGMKEPMLHTAVEAVLRPYSDTYAYLGRHKKVIQSTIKEEEVRFLFTLERGLSFIDERLGTMRSSAATRIDGAFAFKLYDTYGFPIDILSDIAKENGMTVDNDRFNVLMEEQRKKARDASKFGKAMEIKDISLYEQILQAAGPTEFIGYRRLSLKTPIQWIIKDGRHAEELDEGEDGILVFKETPFYAESGGQIGDTGTITAGPSRFLVRDTVRPVEGVIAHIGKVEKGRFTKGQNTELAVDREKRQSTALHHTATHLLQTALRTLIGPNIAQAGSSVGPSRLRFDFTLGRAVTAEELLKVEALVNQWVRENHEVVINFSSLEDAVREGAMALFDEKYKDIVRVVTIDKISKELCGGTHIKRTGDIGLFMIVREASVSAGVRRIEALTGQAAYAFVRERLSSVKELSSALGSSENDVLAAAGRLKQRIKELEAKQANGKNPSEDVSQDILSGAVEVEGIKVVRAVLEGVSIDDMRGMCDILKHKLKTGIGALGSTIEGKATIVVFVTKDLTDRYSASEIIRELAGMVNGSGGGRKDFAQAGGPAVDRLSDAVGQIVRIVQQK